MYLKSQIELTEQLADYLKAYTGLYRIVFSKPFREEKERINKVTIQPVRIAGAILFQFTSYDAKKAIAKNYDLETAITMLHELPLNGFRHINVLHNDATIQIERFSDRKIILWRSKPKTANRELDFSHDKKKESIITPENSTDVLSVLGFLSQNGEIRPTMQKKFKQVNEFIRIVDESSFFRNAGDEALEIVDCGCGNAYLTFMLYHFLTALRSKKARLTGIDRDSDAVRRNNRKSNSLSLPGLNFVQGEISAFNAQPLPTVVLSLHACDTATDEAIANGIRWNSGMIMCAPCCHHHLNRQLKTGNASLLIAPISKYGMIVEKMGDALTDSFRAIILSIMGYSVKTIKFVDPENTERNLLLKAEKKGHGSAGKTIQQYIELKDLLKVTPYLETALGGIFLSRLE
jgi:SAM-dependent methyltransferase